jgi:hypothetical protein
VLAVSDPGDLRRKQLRAKFLALLAVLVALCLLFYAITIARMGGGS